MDVWSALLDKQAKIKTGSAKKEFTDFEVIYSHSLRECDVFIKEDQS